MKNKFAIIIHSRGSHFTQYAETMEEARNIATKDALKKASEGAKDVVVGIFQLVVCESVRTTHEINL